MGRVGFAVTASIAGAAASLLAGAVQAAAPRAEVRGVEDRALRSLIQQAIGEAQLKATSRMEARRRANDAADKAVVVLRSQGYYDYDVEPDIGEGDAPVAFVTVTAGPVSKIASPQIEWVGSPPDPNTQAAATAAMSLKPGEPGRAETVLAAEGRIVAAVEKAGYADAASQPRQVIVDHADQSVQPTFHILAGPLVKLDGVKATTKGRTNPQWVAHLAPWKAGATYRPDQVAELERRLLDTGVYDSVTVSLAPPNQSLDNGERPVIVSLADRPKGTIELGASYSTQEGAGVDSSWTLYNRLGRADTLTNTLRIADIDSRLQAELALPHWRKPEQTLKLTAAVYRDNTRAYDDVGGGVSADLTRRFGKTSFLTWGASVDITSTRENESINYVLGKQNRRLITFGLLSAFSLDRSNDPLNPTRGWKLDARAEPEFSTGDGSIIFFKVTGQAAGYLPLDANGDTVIAARVKLGGIAGGNIPGVPAQQRFYAGGGGSVRGYGYQLVGPRYPDNTPQGGLSLFEASVEARRKITGPWSVAAFIDAGTVGLHVYPEFREPAIGVGLGVRYDLGFGPIRVDIATPLNRRNGDSPVQLYLSIGQSFLSTAAETEPTPTPKVRRRRRFVRWIAIGLAGLLSLVVLAGIAARFWLLTPEGRAFVAARLEGMKLGPVGKLHIEGLQGDVLRDFSFRRVAIIDSRGVWLDAHEVRVQWEWQALLLRRAQIDVLSAGAVLVSRAPLMEATPPGPPGPAPVSVILRQVRLRLETLPAISVQHGLYLVSANLDMERKGGLAGELHGRSLTHAGDGLDARFRLGIGKQLLIDARGREAQGGAIAGMAGLDAKKSFVLDAHADGTADHGRLHLNLESGAVSVAQADGSWTPAGGSGQGRMSMAASRWTSGLLHAFGPELRLSGSGKGLPRNNYDLVLHAASDNATVNLAGLLDAGRLAAPKGLKTQIAIVDLSRIFDSPKMGRGTVDGTLSGRWADWKLGGALNVWSFSDFGYSLGHVWGPAEIAYAKREWRVKANLAGTGGAGQGWIAGLAGAAPKAEFEGVRLADGRLLMKSLKADGAGLKLQATGERSLFGALNFKGDAQFSNLAAAHAGAKGTVAGKWSASQAKAGAAWVFTADAAADKLVTGVAELDRLLGPKPKLTLTASYDKGDVLISKAALVGAAASANTAGVIGDKGDLKLALDWKASGPFELGPIEIAGQAKGGGAITGTIDLPRADLLADFERIDLPNLTLKPAHVVLSLVSAKTGLDGLISIAANSDYGLAHGKAGLHFIEGGISLTDIDAAAGGASAQGSLALRDSSPSSADLSIAVGPGAFLAQGHGQARVRILDQPGGAVGDIEIAANNVIAKGSSLTITQAKLTAKGPLAHLPYTVSADAAGQGWPIKLNGSGVYAQASGTTAISFSGTGKVRHAEFRTLSPILVSLSGPHRTAKAEVAVGGGAASILADQTDEAIDARATLTGVDLTALGEDMAGKVSANIAINGRGSNLGGTLDAALEGARSQDAPAKLALDGHVHAILSGSTIALTAQATGQQSGDKANLALTLPAEASAAPFRIAISKTRPMEGRFDANGELQPIWDLFFGGEQTLGGQLDAQGGIAGTLNSPRLTGHATLANGKFEDSGTGLKLRNLNADVALSETQVDVRQFAGQDAKSGTVQGTGSFSLAAGGQSTLTLNVKAFQLLDNDDAKASATGAVTVTRGGDGKLTLAGALTIDQANISAATRTPPGVVTMDVIERNRPVSEQVGYQIQAGTKGPDIALNIQLRAPRHVYVRGLGLNAELSLNADVGGTLANPVLTGQARIVRGDYDFAGKRFEIDDQGVIYLASSPDRIRLDLTATWDTSSLTAVIKIKGTAAKPQITLTSTPVLPQDEVLSQVLFGSSAAQLSPVEAAQLAAAVATLATGGGFDVMGRLSSFARLDRLALGGDESTGVTVSGGKYVGNHLYLELTGGGRQGASAQVEYRANRAFSIISQVGGLGGAKLSFRWRHDYGKATEAPKAAAAPSP